MRSHRVLGALVLLLVPASLATAAAAAAPRHRRRTETASTGTVWLCRPGAPDDPCTRSLATTSVAANGTRTTQSASPTAGSPYDCFYVYPTVSTQTTANANLDVQPEETAAARAQASPFSQLCDVWAPMYRQTTLVDLLRGITRIPRHAVQVAYRSLLAAWKDFLAHDDDGRPVIFIGHSQGAALLIRLLRAEVDPDPALRARTVLAVLAGGNLQVPTGKLVGATFHHLPLCDTTGETGCVIAYSSFPSRPPPGAQFGIPGTGASVQSGETAKTGQQVACVNPAALSGGTGALDPYFLRAQAPMSPRVATPWETFPGLYRATCEHAGNSTWLDVEHVSGTGRPVVGETAGPDYGYHSDDVNLALGNLLEDAAAAESAYRANS